MNVVDQLRALRPSLTFDGVTPAKAAACALIAPSGPIAPEDVIVSETSSLGESETGVAWPWRPGPPEASRW